MDPFSIAQSVGFITTDPALIESFELLGLIANTNATVLISGETGTGKELVANAIHRCSDRSGKSFVSMNCGAICESLQESEMFGHVAGSFTGAMREAKGRLELAHNGTLFLDEIGEMSTGLQVRLLRSLQSGEYSKVGEAITRVSDFRVIAATNRDLESLVQSKLFRQDLYYRLNIIQIKIPPLRERKCDVPLLIDHFLRQRCVCYKKPRLLASPEVHDFLCEYEFPGNVRELQNIIDFGILSCRTGRVELKNLPSNLSCSPLGSVKEAGNEYATNSSPTETKRFHQAKADAIERFERAFLTSKLKQANGVIAVAARVGGLSERNFHAKLKRYGISTKPFREGILADPRQSH